MSTLPKIVYQPRASRLHGLHPLVKLCWLAGLSVSLFVVSSPLWVLTVLLLAVGFFPLAGLSFRRDVRGIRFLVTMGMLLFLLQMVFNHAGAPILKAGSGPVSLLVTDGGLAAGVYVGGRFLSLVLLSYLFVLTTDPSGLAYALMRVGLPYRYGFVLITALRMAPMFEIEGNTVYQAQLTRGVKYDARTPRRFVTLARQLILPLLVSALRKVDELAVSMEGRCFGKYPTRTYRRTQGYTHWDILALALLGVGVFIVAWSIVSRL
jgi:energy-coupling factor transport system permease protein